MSTTEPFFFNESIHFAKHHAPQCLYTCSTISVALSWHNDEVINRQLINIDNVTIRFVIFHTFIAELHRFA